jgi:hypothetical protein
MLCRDVVLCRIHSVLHHDHALHVHTHANMYACMHYIHTRTQPGRTHPSLSRPQDLLTSYIHHTHTYTYTYTYTHIYTQPGRTHPSLSRVDPKIYYLTHLTHSHIHIHIHIHTHTHNQVVRILVSVDPKIYYLILAAFFTMTMLAAIKTSAVIVFVLSVTCVMLAFAWYLAKWVLARDEGTPEMMEVRYFCLY